MLTVHATQSFEPSKEVKSLWRFTRKQSATAGHVILPGLFATERLVSDTALFMTALILEVYGLVNLRLIGQISLVIVVVAIVIDMALAMLRHRSVGEMQEARNRLVYTADNDQRARLEAKIGRGERAMRFWGAIIVVVAAAKILSFYALQGARFNLLTLGILVSYAIVAGIHIHVTGFFFSAAYLSLQMGREFQAFLGASGDSPVHRIQAVRRRYFSTMAELRAARADCQALTREGDTWVLATYGILTDGQLTSLIGQQSSPAARDALALVGVQHQIEDILPVSPAAADGDDGATPIRMTGTTN